MGMILGSGGSGGRRGRRALNAEINVTPMVDVMLVLLIVFMITAPLITRGEEVTLPKTDSSTVSISKGQPLAVTIDKDGKLYIQQTEIPRNELIAKLNAIADEGFEERIYLRGDTNVNYGAALEVMALIRGAGYQRLVLETDPKGLRGKR